VHDDEPRFDAACTKADGKHCCNEAEHQDAAAGSDGRSIVPTTPADYNCAMGDSVNLTHHFLIAMPAMVDPHFANSLTYVCEHNPDGALGIVVNKPIDMTLSALFEQIEIPLDDATLREAAVHFGGPVQIDRGFVLHRPLGNWQSTLAINDTLGLTTSKDVLEAAGRGEGPKDMFVSLGYAGWSAGQLEMELAQNAWLTVEADPDVVFELPAEGRLPAAVRLLGIDISRLSDTAGHG
jgi:putative transcriptional regulator